MSDEKRKRSPNWLKSEKELLISLVEMHFNLIENKKTDGASIKAKLAQWQIISDQYNSRTTHCARTGENLKNQWESMKKMARKEAAHNRRHKIETGGDSPLPPKKEDPLVDRILSLLSTITAGSFNTFDSDSIVPVVSQEQAGAQAENTFPDPLLIQNEDMPIITIKEHISDTDVCDDDEDDEQENMKEDWVYTPQLLRPPISRPVKINKPQAFQGFSRRRRIHTTATSSLQQLHKKKIEALDLQMKLAKEEMERAKSLHEIDMQLKKEKLRQERINSSILLIRQRKLLNTLSTKKIVKTERQQNLDE